MTVPNWGQERSKLRELFTNGDITKAKRKELERYLVVLANSRAPADYSVPDFFQETKAFATVVRHLLQVRLGEELHEKSHRTSVLALAVAIAAAAFAGCEAWNVYETRQQTTPLSAPAKASELSPSDKSLAPESQFPLKTASTNSKAISQPATNP